MGVMLLTILIYFGAALLMITIVEISYSHTLLAESDWPQEIHYHSSGRAVGKSVILVVSLVYSYK